MIGIFFQHPAEQFVLRLSGPKSEERVPQQIADAPAQFGRRQFGKSRDENLVDR